VGGKGGTQYQCGQDGPHSFYYEIQGTEMNTPENWRNQTDPENTGQIPRHSTGLQAGMETQCSGKGEKGQKKGAICIQEDA